MSLKIQASACELCTNDVAGSWFSAEIFACLGASFQTSWSAQTCCCCNSTSSYQNLPPPLKQEKVLTNQLTFQFSMEKSHSKPNKWFTHMCKASTIKTQTDHLGRWVGGEGWRSTTAARLLLLNHHPRAPSFFLLSYYLTVFAGRLACSCPTTTIHANPPFIFYRLRPPHP